MNNKKNYLNKSEYLISKQLHDCLNNEKLTNGSPIISKRPSIYVVAVRLLNKADKTSVYNYIYYDPIFLDTFLNYLFSKNICSNRFNEWGDTLFVLDSTVFNKKYTKFELSDDNYSRYFFTNREDLLVAISNIDHYYVNNAIYKLISIINRINFISKDSSELAHIIDLSIKKDIIEYIHFIIDPLYKNKYKSDLNLDQWTYDPNEINIINSCLYVVNDINDLKNKLTNKGYLINEGLQRWRGQINSMSGILSTMDMDYRNSLYNHNEYHVKLGEVDRDFYLPKSKFSFRNIHMNLGNVKWYSTTRKTTKLNKTDKLIKRVKTNTFQTDSIVYLYLNRFLQNSPINSETERQLESFLLEYFYRKLSEKDKSAFNYQIFQDNKLQKILLDSIDLLKI